MNTYTVYLLYKLFVGKYSYESYIDYTIEINEHWICNVGKSNTFIRGVRRIKDDCTLNNNCCNLKFIHIYTIYIYYIFMVNYRSNARMFCISK